MNNYNNGKRNPPFTGTPLSSYRVSTTERQTNRGFHSATNYHESHRHHHRHISNNHTKQHGSRWGLPSSQPPPQNNRYTRFQDNNRNHNRNNSRRSPLENNTHSQFHNNRSPTSQSHRLDYSPSSSIRNNTIIPPPTRYSVPWGNSSNRQRATGNNIVTPSPPSPHGAMAPSLPHPPPVFSNDFGVKDAKSSSLHQRDDGSRMMMPPPPPRSCGTISQPAPPSRGNQSLPQEYLESTAKIVKEQLQHAVSSCPPTSFIHNSTTIPPAPTHYTIPLGSRGSQQRNTENNQATASPPPPHGVMPSSLLPPAANSNNAGGGNGAQSSSLQQRDDGSSDSLLEKMQGKSPKAKDKNFDNILEAAAQRLERQSAQKQQQQDKQQRQQHDDDEIIMPPPPPCPPSRMGIIELVNSRLQNETALSLPVAPTPNQSVERPIATTTTLDDCLKTNQNQRQQRDRGGIMMPPPPPRRDNKSGTMMPPPPPRRGGTVSQPTPPPRAYVVGPAKRHLNETTVSSLPAAPATPIEHVEKCAEEPIVARTRRTETTATTTTAASSPSYSTDSPAQVQDQSSTATPPSDVMDITDITSPTSGKIHVIFAIDRSGSMRKKDITGPRNGKKQTRWDAVFTCAAEFIKEQTTNDDNDADDDLAFSLVLFEDSATLEFERRDPHAALLEMERVRTTLKPQYGTNYGAAWEIINDVSSRRRGTNGNKDEEERQWIVFLSDGRPAGLTNCRGRVSDYVSMTLTSAKAQKAKIEKKGKKNWVDYTGVVSLEKVVGAFNPILHFICIHNDGKTWMQQLAKYFDGSFHMPELRLDSTRDKDSSISVASAPPTAGVEETELQVLGSKSAETLRAERFKEILARQSVIHLDEDDNDDDVDNNKTTTPGTMRDTFRCISTALTTMRRPPRAKQLRERLTDIHLASERPPGSTITTTTHPATLMVLDETKSKFVVPPDETRDGRICHIATWPFAQGGLRNVYDIREEGSSAGAKMVAKESRHIVAYTDRLRFHLESYRCHLSASSAALTFNKKMEESCCVKRGNRSIRVTLLDPAVYRLRDTDASGGFRYLAVEEKLEGTYTKYNSNNGFVKVITASSNDNKNGNNDNVSTQRQQEFIDVAQCFSHFSYVFRKGKEIVVDIQGVGFQYTDPQIHSLSMEYGLADRGQRGIDDFFKTHVCSSFCRRLDLPMCNKGLKGQKQKKQQQRKRTLKQKTQEKKRQCKEVTLQDDIIDLTDD